LAEGARAALSTALIVALDAVLHEPNLMVAALAAWLTCLGDAGGPIRSRVPALLAFAVLGTAITTGFGLLGNAPLWLVVPLACIGIFCLSFARVWGPAAMQVGNLLTVTLVLALRIGITDLSEALVLGLMFLGGSLWALLITMVVWRVYPNLPARRAIADCYVALGDLVGDLRAMLRAPDISESVWERHAREHRRNVRDAIERARGLVLETLRGRGALSARSTQSWIRLEAADQIFGALIGLSDGLESSRDKSTRDAANRILARLRPVLRLLAAYIVTDRPDRLQRLERAVAAMAGSAPPGSPLHVPVERIVDRVRIAINLATPEGFLRGSQPGDPSPTWRARVLTPLRANLNFRSTVLLHALRIAAASIPAAIITLVWSVPYGYWMMITLVMTMQPFFALTFTRALERIGGTVLGGALAAALAYVCTTPMSLAVAIFPLAIIAFSLRQVSFGLFITGITPIVVLLVEIKAPGESELYIAMLRALYTLIGGGLAVVFSVLLWPSWEPGRLVTELRAAVAAHGRYARTEIAAVLREASEADVEAARRAAGLASNNVEASLQRALLEPRGDAALEPALVIDAALRRMAGRLSALQLDPGAGHDPKIWHDWRDWIDEAMGRLSSGRTDLVPRPKLPPGDRHADALARLARQIELIGNALGRVRTA
jgi:uncharacterized membrane protein YccC